MGFRTAGENDIDQDCQTISTRRVGIKRVVKYLGPRGVLKQRGYIRSVGYQDLEPLTIDIRMRSVVVQRPLGRENQNKPTSTIRKSCTARRPKRGQDQKNPQPQRPSCICQKTIFKPEEHPFLKKVASISLSTSFALKPLNQFGKKITDTPPQNAYKRCKNRQDGFFALCLMQTQPGYTNSPAAFSSVEPCTFAIIDFESTEYVRY